MLDRNREPGRSVILKTASLAREYRWAGTIGVGIQSGVLQRLGHIPSRYYQIRDHDVGSGECIVEPILGMERVYASLVIADNRSRELNP